MSLFIQHHSRRKRKPAGFSRRTDTSKSRVCGANRHGFQLALSRLPLRPIFLVSSVLSRSRARRRKVARFRRRIQPRRGSKASKKLAQPQAHRLGDPHGRVNGDVFFSAFHPADVHGREIGFFSQRLLGEIGLYPAGANSFAKNSSVLRNSVQSSVPKQQPCEIAI